MCLTVDALSVGASKFASGVLGARTSPTLLLAGMLYNPLFACLRLNAMDLLSVLAFILLFGSCQVVTTCISL